MYENTRPGDKLSGGETHFLHETAPRFTMIGGETQWLAVSGECHGHPAREGDMAKMAMAQGAMPQHPLLLRDVLEIKRVISL